MFLKNQCSINTVQFLSDIVMYVYQLLVENFCFLSKVDFPYVFVLFDQHVITLKCYTLPHADYICWLCVLSLWLKITYCVFKSFFSHIAFARYLLMVFLWLWDDNKLLSSWNWTEISIVQQKSVVSMHLNLNLLSSLCP